MNADLILWRHAEAEDLADNEETGGSDLSRRLTAKGEKQGKFTGADFAHDAGAFMTDSSTVSGTTGTLLGVGNFTGGDRAVQNGDTLNVTVTASIS